MRRIWITKDKGRNKEARAKAHNNLWVLRMKGSKIGSYPLGSNRTNTRTRIVSLRRICNLSKIPQMSKTLRGRRAILLLNSRTVLETTLSLQKIGDSSLWENNQTNNSRALTTLARGSRSWRETFRVGLVNIN